MPLPPHWRTFGVRASRRLGCGDCKVTDTQQQNADKLPSVPSSDVQFGSGLVMPRHGFRGT